MKDWPPPRDEYLSGEQQKFAKRIDFAKEELKLASEYLDSLVNQCKHKFPPFTEQHRQMLRDDHNDTWGWHIVCGVCGHMPEGWLCPESPDQICHYHSTNGHVKMMDGTLVPIPTDHDPLYETPDSCIFCGQPEERK